MVGAMSSTRTAGLIGAAVGGALALGGAAVTAVHVSERDRDGYYHADTVRLRSDGYAATSKKLDVNGLDGDVERALAGDLRVRIDPEGARALFVGIARQR